MELRLKYEQAVETRNFTGTQLIDRTIEGWSDTNRATRIRRIGVPRVARPFLGSCGSKPSKATKGGFPEKKRRRKKDVNPIMPLLLVSHWVVVVAVMGRSQSGSIESPLVQNPSSKYFSKTSKR